MKPADPLLVLEPRFGPPPLQNPGCAPVLDDDSRTMQTESRSAVCFLSADHSRFFLLNLQRTLSQIQPFSKMTEAYDQRILLSLYQVIRYSTEHDNNRQRPRKMREARRAARNLAGRGPIPGPSAKMGSRGVIPGTFLKNVCLHAIWYNTPILIASIAKKSLNSKTSKYVCIVCGEIE